MEDDIRYFCKKYINYKKDGSHIKHLRQLQMIINQYFVRCGNGSY